MKHTILYILTAALLSACTAEESMPQGGKGFLALAPIQIETQTEAVPLKRSIDSRLQVDIYQGSTIVRTYEAGAAELGDLISLPAGSYTLTAHTPNTAEAADNEQGSPIYSVSRTFDIIVNQTTPVTGLAATQVNAGIRVEYTDDLFTTAFTSLTCTLTSPSGRNVAIEGTDNRALTYFNLPSTGTVEYTIHATNTDGETFILGPKTITVDAPKNYYLTVGWED